MTYDYDPTDIAFCVPLQKYLYRDHTGRYSLDNPVGKDGVVAHLTYYKVDPELIGAVIDMRGVKVVHGWGMAPNEPELFLRGDHHFINTWVKPLIDPAPGEWPTIRFVLDHLTNHDPAGQQWIFNWFAAKVQDPLFLAKVALVFVTQPGGGKGTLASVFRAILGRDNTATITAGDLENRFNRRWIGKLFVFADEVVDKDTPLKDVSNKLKILIDSAEVQLEGKGTNQAMVANPTSWMFASNDVVPLLIEQGDRRYTVFDNLAEVPQSHKDFLMSQFIQEGDRSTPTPEFAKEMAAFYYDLKAHKVDKVAASTPYVNQARAHLMHASKPAHVQFVEAVREQGIYELIAQADNETPGISFLDKRESWDFGADGILSSKVYAAYRAYCKRVGMGPMRDNRFGAEMRRYWDKHRRRLGGKQVYVYQIPMGERGPSAPGEISPPLNQALAKA